MAFRQVLDTLSQHLSRALLQFVGRQALEIGTERGSRITIVQPRRRAGFYAELRRDLFRTRHRILIMSLPRHGDAETFFGIDEVVVVVVAEIELHPVDLAGEPARVLS